MVIKFKNPHGVHLLSSTFNPNETCYMALHQCYSDYAVALEPNPLLSEEEYGNRLVKNCIKFGHWSVIEHAQMVFNVWGFPHDVLVQARTHRHLSFSAQSQRYTYKRVYDLGNQYLLNGHGNTSYDELLDLFYFREPGQTYLDREGNKYHYSYELFESDVVDTFNSVVRFAERIHQGYAPEHARQILPQNIRQHFVLSCNARALLHFCDLRLPADAQLEIRKMATLLFENFETYMPEVAQWYRKNRYGKSRLAP